MKKIYTLSALALVATLATTSHLAAQALPEVDAGSVDPENPLSVWLHSVEPNTPHRALAERTGTWAVVYRSWYKPGDQPVEVIGVAERSMILGGRVLEEKLDVQMPGRPFTGVSHLGYDNVNEQYWWRRLDNMSTWGTNSVSAARAEDGSITFEVPVMNHTDGTEATAKVVLRTEADSEIHEWHQPDASGEMFKSIEFEYTRTAKESDDTAAEADGSATGR